MGGWIRQRRRLWFALAVALLLGILIAGPNYGEAQVTDTAQQFRNTIGQEAQGRHAVAGAFDVLFAVAYAFVAIAIVWPAAGTPDPLRLRRSATGLFIAGALFDEVENVALLRNLANFSTLEDSSVEFMHSAGKIKMALLLIGLMVFGLALLAPQFATRALRRQAWTNFWQWVRTSAVPYWSFIAAVAAIVMLVGWRTNDLAVVAAVVLLVALPFLASRLNRCVAADRATATPHRQARVILATVQLVAGVVLFRVFGESSDRLAGVCFFIGLAFIAMSLGSYVSELRTFNFWNPRRGPILMAVAMALLLAATFVNGSTLFFQLLIGGAVVGLIGAELASEDYQRNASADTNRRLLIGIALAAVGASLLVVGGFDPLHVGLIIVFLVAAAAMASAAADGLIVVLVLVLAVLWATSPVSKELDPATEPVASQPYFAALGDSYISGEGATAYIKDTNKVIPDDERKPGDDYTNECRRAPTAWPFLVAQRANEISPTFPDRVLFLPCSGARTYNIHTKPHFDEEGKRTSAAQLALLQREITQRRRANPDDPNAAPRFVMLSIGGNDAGFSEFASCLAPGDCSELARQFLAKIRPKEKPNDVDFDDKLAAAYTRLRAVVGDGVPVFVVTYPMPVDAAGRCTGVLLDVNERVFLRGFTRELNRRLASAVNGRDGFVYLDLADALTRQRAQLCASATGAAGLNFFALHSKDGAIRDTVNPANWTHNSMHPNARGHEAIADHAVESLRAYFENPEAANSPFNTFALSSVRDVLDGTPVPQCDPETRESCRLGTTWLVEQVENFFSAKLLPLAILMLGLWIAISPLMWWGREEDLTLPSALRRTAAWLNGSSQ